MMEQIQKIEGEQLGKLIREVLSHPKKYRDEAKLLLKVKLVNSINKYPECKQLYTVWSAYNVIYGIADAILKRSVEETCTETTEVVFIPRTVPTVIMVQYHDEGAETEDYVKIFVFNGESWKALAVDIPEP
ncbi:MAG: hypothetical protein LM558_05000 [Thermosphaera sp.]|nr:hypothetical protein [Thermosphaera sp.]